MLYRHNNNNGGKQSKDVRKGGEIFLDAAANGDASLKIEGNCKW